MKHFVPLTTYEPPLSTAWQRMAPRSLPASGSVLARHDTRSSTTGNSRACCSAVPAKRSTITAPKCWNSWQAAVEWRAISSAMITHSVDPAPAPP